MPRDLTSAADLKTLLLVMTAASAGVMLLLSLPLISRRFGPNRWYGFRTPRTLADPKLWYAANAIAGKRLAAAALTILAGAIGFYFVPRWQVEHYAIANLAVTVLALAYAITQSLVFVRSWKEKAAEATEPQEQEGTGE